MPKLVRWDWSVNSFTIPTPPVDIQWREIGLPDVPGLQLPTIETPSVSIPLPDLSLPSLTIPDVSVDSGFESIDLGSVGPFFIPTDVNADLTVDWTTVEIPVIDTEITYPTDVDLYGPYLEYGSIGPYDLGSVSIPTVDVAVNYRDIDLPDLTLPTVDVPGVSIPLPDLPSITLPSVPVPEGIRLTGEIAIPDPTTFDLDISINTKPLTDFVTQFLPDGFIRNPTLWALTAVLSEAEQRLEGLVIPAVKSLLEGVLQVALTEETKQALRDQRDN